MSYRIKQSDLEWQVSKINELTKSPKEPWTRKGKKFNANIGNYHLSYAYGGVALHRMSNKHGGVTSELCSYHTPKRELYNRMAGFIAGLEA